MPLINDSINFLTVARANVAVSGNIGTAATTVDVSSHISITQTTANLTLTLPNPTNALPGHFCMVSNAGTAQFTMYNKLVQPGKSIMLVFNSGTWRSDSSKIMPLPTAPTMAISGFTTTGSLVGTYLSSDAQSITYSWFLNCTIPNVLGWKTFTAPTIAGYATPIVRCSTYRSTNATGFPAAPAMGREVHCNYNNAATSYLGYYASLGILTVALSITATYTLS